MAGSLRIVGGELTLPSNLIINADINSDAAISSDKVLQYQKHLTDFRVNTSGFPGSTRNSTVFVASRACTVKRFACAITDVTTGGTVDVDFDIKVNGTSILSAPLTITDANSDRQVVETTSFTPDGALTVDDHVLIELVPNDVTGSPAGPYAWVEIEELGGFT